MPGCERIYVIHKKPVERTGLEKQGMLSLRARGGRC
jgi:hypothetical protein